jgi:hypothetical protein
VSDEKAFPESATNKASWGFLYPIGGFCIWRGGFLNGESFKSKLVMILSADAKGKEVQDATGISDVR